MYTIRVTDQNKEGLPNTMLYAVRSARGLGDLDGLVHAKDDIIREVDYGFEMTSCWDTPEEVAKHNCHDPLNNTTVHEECLEKALELLYDLLHKCKSCVVLPEINATLTEIDELLKDLE